MGYLQTASKVMTERVFKFERDRDSFIAGLTEDEKTAYGEYVEIMTGEKFKMTPEAAHIKTKELLETYWQNQKERKHHAKTI